MDTSTLPGTAGQLTNSLDPDGGADSSSTVALSAGQVELGQDFGYRDLASPNTITGTLWEDADADGVLDAAETQRYGGVTVMLYTLDGNLVATTTTASNGRYTFAGLPDGTYTVDVTDEGNVLEGTWQTLGANSQADPFDVVDLAGGETRTVDFGYYLDPAAVGNFVWADLDRDGLQDVSEAGLDGVQVTLTITYPNGAGSTVLSTVTGDNPATTSVETGWYSFANLLLDESFNGTTSDGSTEATYLLTVATPAGYLTSPLNQGANDALDSEDPSGQAVTLVQGRTDTTYDFGFLVNGSLSGVVFRDYDGDGVQDAGDTPMSGVTVYLDLDNDGRRDSGEPATLTDALGAYSFSSLGPGTYYVRQVVPSSYLQTLPASGAAQVEILGPGEAATGLDFGNLLQQPLVADDGTASVTLSGGWSVSYCPLFYGADGRYICNGTGSVTWVFGGLIDGAAYRVSATWLAGSAFANSITYDINAGGALVTSPTFNQQNPPSFYAGYSADGRYWADLASSVTVTGDTLTVTLSVTPDMGCVNADAVRIVQTTPAAPLPPGPDPGASIAAVGLAADGLPLANLFGAVDFGSVTVGAAASKTFTVTNTGTVDLELCPPTLPDGFSLTSTYGDTSLAPHQSTTFVVSMTTAAASVFSGNLVLCTIGGEGLFSVQLAGTVTPPTATKAILDDGDAGFTAGGFTTYSSGSGYLGDVRYATPNTVETKVAQWQFRLSGLGLTNGLYRVSTLWYVESSRASQATFKMYNGAAAGTPQTAAVVNQQAAPRADVVDEGRNWQDLGVVLVSGGVLTVTVSDLAVGGAVVADAVRIERVVAAEVQVALDSNGADLVDGSVVSFGSVFAGSTSQLTLRVKNGGSGTVTLSAPTLTGTGFTLVSGPASTSLSANDGAAGGADETTITIAMNTSVAGSKSGTLSLVNSDADENPFELTLQGTVSSVKIIDDGDSGFAQSGPSVWLTWADGYQQDLRYSAKNTGRTATWTFSDLPSGTYRVSTTWVRSSNRATNAPYTISDGGGTVLVNQELAPNSSGFTWLLESGKYFADLRGGVLVTDGMLVVSLTDVGANEYVVADAVRIERVAPLLASAGAASPPSAAPALESVPAQTVARAMAYWASADPAAAAKLSTATILVADLPDRHLGLASPVTNAVWLDADGAGYGWELGSGPLSVVRGQSSLVRGAGAGGIQAGGVDLWQVLTHEFGHLLGLGDLDADQDADELMAGQILPEWPGRRSGWSLISFGEPGAAGTVGKQHPAGDDYGQRVDRVFEAADDWAWKGLDERAV